MKLKTTLVLLSSLTLFLLFSCNNFKGNQTSEKMTVEVKNKVMEDNTKNIDSTHIDAIAETYKSPKLLAEELKTRLQNGKSLKSLFSNKWELIFHKDDRCEGSTDGQINNLTDNQIDEIIKIQVRNNGNGWDCEKKQPSKYNISFLLSKQVKTWDRFEISQYDEEKKIYFIVGEAESGYLIIHYADFKNKYLIVKLEYRSEDPG